MKGGGWMDVVERSGAEWSGVEWTRWVNVTG